MMFLQEMFLIRNDYSTIDNHGLLSNVITTTIVGRHTLVSVIGRPKHVLFVVRLDSFDMNVQKGRISPRLLCKMKVHKRGR